MADVIAAREAEVLGKAPRVQPLKSEEIADATLEIRLHMKRASGQDHFEMRADNVPEVLLIMLRHPELCRKHTDLGLFLLGSGTLSPRDRELAVLRVAWLCQAPYEWGEHVAVAKSQGMTSEEVERITVGSAAAGWSEHDCAILRAVEELLTTAMISDETWAMLARTLDEQQLIELPVLIGQYQGTAYFQNALRLRLQDHNPGLSAR
jgi:alkylhydroperoxidase family enzyme